MQSKKFLRASQLSLLVDVQGLMAGVDEVGRGPLAGPVVAAAVILDERRVIRGLNDSKMLTAPTRERLSIEIRKKALCVSIGARDGRRDRSHQHPAGGACWRCAAPSTACASCPRSSSSTATSCRRCRWRAAAIVGGDSRVRAISAASIVAKVYRDRLCNDLHDEHPEYGFASHKGYSTPEHLDALRRHGACRHHRRSFAPVRDVL